MSFDRLGNTSGRGSGNLSAVSQLRAVRAGCTHRHLGASAHTHYHDACHFSEGSEMVLTGKWWGHEKKWESQRWNLGVGCGGEIGLMCWVAKAMKSTVHHFTISSNFSFPVESQTRWEGFK